ncbi:hypothetical protein QAD02_003890 [Eretmocerus hayati]|uniref:Uncharacterized protein n=1 Tax=Eretmocerus hayati TaxID=131215 RepID=A0ACC2NNZ4_9HYME|nr:hypothetical protein QAD02_003890 [Eretmocerus hayati]
MIRRLLQLILPAGSDRAPDFDSKYHLDRLLEAIAAHDIDSVNILIKADVDQNCAKFSTISPLHRAIEIEDRQVRLQIVKLLVASGASVKQDHRFEDEYGDSCMHKSVRSGDFELVELLHYSGAKLNRINSLGKTPILTAIKLFGSYMRLNLVALLIKYGADVEIKDADVEGAGGTCLHYCASTPDNMSCELMSLLISSGADINCLDEQAQPPLGRATAHVNVDIRLIEFMIEAGADVNISRVLSSTPLYVSFPSTTPFSYSDTMLHRY